MLAATCLLISDGSIGNDALKVVAPAGCLHAERREDVVVRELGERFARDALHQDRKQVIAGVGVGPLVAGLVIEGFLMRSDVNYPGVAVLAG